MAPSTPRVFTEDDFRQICAFGARLDLPDGAAVFRAGDREQAMYFVETGQVELVFPGGKSAKVFGPGKFFGELAFVIGDHCRTATALCRGGCTLVRIDQSTVDVLLRADPGLLFALLRHTCTYLLGSEQALISDLQRKNDELTRTIDFLRRTRDELTAQELAARTDPLTGLYNRRCFGEQLPKAVERARALGGGLAVLMLDLDGFKAVNDTLGHPGGDDVLKRMAGVLISSARRSDLVCRLGGDEFAVVLDDVPPPRATEVAEKIRSAALDAFAPEAAHGVPVSCSIGVALLDGDLDADALLARADKNLYQAKRLGKNRTVVEGSL